MKTSFEDVVPVTATPSGMGVDCFIPFRLLLPYSEFELEPEPGPKSGVRWRGVSKVAGAEIFRSDRSRVESKTPGKRKVGKMV